jgi:16S rRNA (uracil1498-N3)-methyltransferase
VTRFYLETELSEGQTITLPDSAFRHWVQVLRARVGDQARLFNGDGSEHEAMLVAIAKRDAQVTLGRRHIVDRESPLRLLLAQAVSKGERMDYTLQKAVELGVSAIQPLISERTVVKLDAERWDKKLEHWRGIVIAACEQSGRARIPELRPVLRFDHWLAQPLDCAARLILAPGAARTLRELPAAHSAALLIGPEGGFSDAEIEQARQQGWAALTLGPRVLRTETAGVAAMSALQALWGDLAGS